MVIVDVELQSALIKNEVDTGNTPGSLCATCGRLFEALSWLSGDIGPDNSTLSHHPTILELSLSADSGCHLCSLFYGSIMLAPSDCLPNEYYFRGGPLVAEVHRIESESGGGVSLRLIDASNRQGHAMKLQCHIEPKGVCKQVERESLAKSIGFSTSTASNQSTVIAKDWLERCLLDHDICRQPCSGNRVVPSRLIKINADPCCMQLVLNGDPRVKYLILSYCWGPPKDNDLKLTQENEGSLLDQLHFAHLPKTIQHAVLLTKRLGHTYLWVDRLCILQGDMSDWKYEGARMGDYYLNAECCIAALRSTDSYQGLFTRRNPLCMQSLIIETSSAKLSIAANVGGVQGDYPRLFRGPTYPLGKRAWALQERLLSPRTLYYGSMMIYWECRTMCRKEAIPEDQLELPFSQQLRKFGSHSTNGLDDLWHTPVTGTEMENFEDRWASLVQFYTGCQMTYATDRLIAISGLMNTITQRTGLEFVCGLLRTRLTTELLWWQWVDWNGNENIVPERNVDVPTWSWGSVRGRIEPIRSNRLLSTSRLPWQMDAEASIIDERGELPPGYRSDDKVKHICRIQFDTPLLEATILQRLEGGSYNWQLQAVASTSPDSFVRLSVQMWPDEPVHEGKIVWLLRMARVQHPKTLRWRFGGIVIMAARDLTDIDIYGWKRVGYWEGDHLVPHIGLTDQEKASAQRTLTMFRLKSCDLI